LASLIFRFYEELNDFLPPDQRKREVKVAFDPPVPVRHLIEECGVPHTEVELILRNGVSVGLEEPAADGDRIAVYPLFEAIDITPLVRIRDRPLREPRFLADAQLGKLARFLRMLGFDTRYAQDCGADPGDRALVRIAGEERRILLTRDRALLMHRSLTHGCFVRSKDPQEQLAQVIARVDLCGALRPFSRCMECNGGLVEVEPVAVVDQLPEKVREGQKEFWRCGGCGRVYWKGTHYQRMTAFIEAICREWSVS